MTRWKLCSALAGALVTAPLAAQDTASGMLGLRFMTGCWQGRTASGTIIEEHYTTPSQNLMLGTTRYLRDGGTRSYEFAVISLAGEVSQLTPHPGGKASVSFREGQRTTRSVSWENPSHDFPQRIRYERVSADSLVATIELMDGSRATGYRMGKVACPG